MKNMRCVFGITFDLEQEDIYVLGGYAGGIYLDNCEKYSPERNEWTTIMPMIEKKKGVSACVVDNKFVYAIGGHDGSKYLNTIERYSI